MSLFLDRENIQSNLWDYYPSISISKIAKNNEYLNENLRSSTNSINTTFEDDEEECGNAFSKIFNSSKNDSNIDENDNDNANEEKTIHFQTKTEESNTRTKDSNPQNIIFKVVRNKNISSKKNKEKRKKGRMSMVNRPLYQPKHDKKSTDNIISKIKRHFVRSTLNYINKKYNEFLSTKITEKKRILLMKIIPNSYKVYSRKANQKFLNLYLYQLFSQDLSDRITEYSKDYNRKQIKFLYEKNEAKEVIEIMNLTVKEMYEIYISNKIPEYNLEKDLNYIIKEKDQENSEEEGNKYTEENEKEIIEYKSKVKIIAENLIYFLNKEGKRVSTCKI